jgi:hypothetical protein
MYPSRYPLEKPIDFEIVKATGIVGTDSVLSEQLVEVVRSEAENGIGYAIVYQIIERVVEFLRDHNEEEKSLHDQLTSLSRTSVPKVKRQTTPDDDDNEEDDSDWSEDEDDSEYDSDDDSYEDEEEEEDYKGLQLKTLCPESERVTIDQFAAWKLSYDQWLMDNKWIKRVSEADVKPTGKQQFLSILVSRRSKETVASGQPADGVLDEFDEELFGEEDFGDLDEFEDGNE